MGTIYILWLRQLKRYVRAKSRIVGSLGQPILFLLALGYGFGSVFQASGQGNYLQFLAPGIVGMSILFTAIFGGIEVIWDKQFGFLKETLVAPVSRIQIMFGRSLGGATVAVIQGVIVLGLATLFGFRPLAGQIPLALLFMFLIALLFTALGTAIASVLNDMQGFQLIMNFLVMPMFFLSGALFPLTGLPKILNIITRVNPMTYGVDGLRGLLVGSNHFSIANDFFVISIITLVFLGIGSYLFNKIEA
jgi:ABC-2 type transport system permease protein